MVRWKRHHPRWLAAAVLPLVFAIGPFVPGGGSVQPAFANGPCTGLLYHFDGQTASVATWGAMANIVLQDSAFCSGSTSSANHISAWALVNGAGSQYELAQAGYIKVYGTDSTPRNFAEYDDDYNNYGFKYLGGIPPNGSNNFYYDEYDTSSHTEDMVVNDTYMLQTSFDPDGDWPGPWEPQYLGEVHDAGDEMPGTSSARVSFTNVQYEPNYGGGFTTPYGESPTQDQGCQQWYDNSAFDIWRC